jgi:hypothetical protein
MELQDGGTQRWTTQNQLTFYTVITTHTTTTTPGTWGALWSHGNVRVYERGRDVVNLLKENIMKDMNTFYQHKLHDTWQHNFNNSKYAHDHFLVRPAGKNISITDVCICRDRCQSDHLPIKIEVKIKSRRAEVNSGRPNVKENTRPTLKINADLLKVTAKRLAFQSIISEVITHKPN